MTIDHSSYNDDKVLLSIFILSPHHLSIAYIHDSANTHKRNLSPAYHQPVVGGAERHPMPAQMLDTLFPYIQKTSL